VDPTYVHVRVGALYCYCLYNYVMIRLVLHMEACAIISNTFLLGVSRNTTSIAYRVTNVIRYKYILNHS